MRAQKATSKMFLLLKALPFNCPSILIRSYKAYVLPLLDFASPFWNPHYSSDIATLEKVQHTFTRQLFYRCFPSPDYPFSLPSYSDRIKTLALRALTERRRLACSPSISTPGAKFTRYMAKTFSTRRRLMANGGSERKMKLCIVISTLKNPKNQSFAELTFFRLCRSSHYLSDS
ncbi:hypothetical protein PRIPAC_71216 [Pristionchus pacificus]|uniref:Uncharacterized protein n=1 Tax=Pristionchus pacificus TaxID=54126 RepID=A0A2A6CGB4_PRIPA|nr:hypothetical protein PRIPAC_71216 [Pristionchus pacificus]|eukprot:PDM77136.1 hypothetical protein PRIPAC_43048 [Pristionchus pacificus]